MEQEQVNKQKQPPILMYAAIVVVILAAIVWLLLMPSEEPAQPQAVPAPIASLENDVMIEPETEQGVLPDEVQSVPVQPTEVEPEVPVETVSTEAVEPKVNYDDAWLMANMVELIPNSTLTNLLIEQDLISNFVVFVDNASRGELVTQFSPVKAPEQGFKALQDDNDLLSYELDEQSFNRYDVYADLFAALPVEKSVEIFTALTPAIDEAHRELGYEAGTFNAKLKRALDFLIDAPILTENTKLVAPSAMYQYADPELEGLLAIQKLLLRMGPENQQKVRAKLVAFSAAL